jgi:GH24 family phage-related lysozyme (muramidase)|tara:strand:- start:2002 stop:2448 length:447 start_codon:yes stop_codon:yes gene_type:complete
MRTAAAGLAIIKRFEGWSPGPYLDPIGIPTIGYGSIWGMDKKRITLEHPAITEEQGEELLRREVAHSERAIRRLIRVRLNQGQFSALVSFTYNLGSGRLQGSTLRQKANRGDMLGAADEFPKWRRAGGRILRGLVRRRAEERALWLAG